MLKEGNLEFFLEGSFEDEVAFLTILLRLLTLRMEDPRGESPRYLSSSEDGFGARVSIDGSCSTSL